MGTGSGFGKVILFNEHFVVYGIPAIASAIENKTTAKVRRIPEGINLRDERNATPSYKEEKREQQMDSLNRIITAMRINGGLEIWLGGDLRAASGVGASAASCTAIARAVSDEFGLGYTDEQINDVAYEGEKGYHGVPSGIDNTAATFGGLVWFKSGNMKRLKVPEPVEIVMGNTGIVANTKKAVEGVRVRREQHRGKYDRIFDDATELVNSAEDVLLAGKWKEVGQYMDRNHELLQEIEVSSKELDFLVEVARDNGAYGAKMTGGGLGGYMVALTPGGAIQEEVSSAIEKEGFYVLRTRIGV